MVQRRVYVRDREGKFAETPGRSEAQKMQARLDQAVARGRARKAAKAKSEAIPLRKSAIPGATPRKSGTRLKSGADFNKVKQAYGLVRPKRPRQNTMAQIKKVYGLK